MTRRPLLTTIVTLAILLIATTVAAGAPPPPPLPGQAVEPTAAPATTSATESESPPEADAEEDADATEETDAEEDTDTEEDTDDDDHEGFFVRGKLGIGYGRIIGQGALSPLKGLREIEDPLHGAAVGHLALDLGGGLADIAIHVGVSFEHFLFDDTFPTEMRSTLFGIGGGLTWYFTDNDFFLGLDVKLIGLLLEFPGVACEDYFADRFEWLRGPGFSLAVGKEWFGENRDGTKDDGAVGLALQANTAILFDDPDLVINAVSVLVVLTLTKF